MRISIYLSTLLIILLTGCPTPNTSNEVVTAEKPMLGISQEEKWRLMIGKWYGSQPTKDGGTKKHIVERAGDGTYRIVFRVYKADGSFEESTEVGLWGVSGPIYFTIFKGWLNGTDFSPSNPSDPYNYDAYEILHIGAESFEYKNYSSGNSYAIERVSNDFTFPE